MAVFPAQGCGNTFEGTPAGSFKRGDLLTGKPSALSRSTGTDVITGIALADSTQTINGKIPFMAPGADQTFWCTVASNSTLATGDTISFELASNTHRAKAEATAANVRGVVVKGVSEISNFAVEPRVLITIVRDNSKQLFG